MKRFNIRAFWKDTKKPIEDFLEEYLCEACNYDAFIVHHSTGLFDKEGKEIFEGDFYRVENESDLGDNRTYMICVWIEELARFAFMTPEEKFDYETLNDKGKLLNGDWWWGIGLHDSKKIKIIGNIVENIDKIQTKEFVGTELVM